MSSQKKVLVLESDKLMSAGLLSMLASQTEFELLKTTGGFLESLDWFREMVIDVVIIEEMLLAENVSIIIQLADQHPNLRLIVFRLNDSKVQVFDKQIVEVKSVSTFLDLLSSPILKPLGKMT